MFISIEQRLEEINAQIGLNHNDLVIRHVNMADGKYKCCLVFIRGMVNQGYISRDIIKPLIQYKEKNNTLKKNLKDMISRQIIYAAEITETSCIEEIINNILIGFTALFIDGVENVLLINTVELEKRQPDKSETEASPISSMEAFAEDIEVNYSLLRKRLPIPSLKFEDFNIGKLSRTKVRLIWLDGVSNSNVLKKVHKRLRNIHIDNVMNIGVLAELIEDKPMTLISSFDMTEKPDILAQNLAEGRIAVICDNIPQAIFMPVVIWQNFHAAEDYSLKPIYGSFIRLTRYISAFITLFISPFYLAVVSYNHIIIPPVLAKSILSGRVGVPFPSWLEVLVMTLMLDIIRELSMRIPGNVGQTIGILGAVVIGQAAVSAGFVSPSLIIVVAASAITIFNSRTMLFRGVLRITSYFLILLAATLGLFGLTVGVVIIIWRLSNTDSFGIPIIYPLAESEKKGRGDTLIRGPIKKLIKRPNLMTQSDKRPIKNRIK